VTKVTKGAYKHCKSVRF